MKFRGNGSGRPVRRVMAAGALLLGLAAVVILIINGGSLTARALDPNDPIDVVDGVVDFGVVVPGQTYADDFTVCIRNPASGDRVDYGLALTERLLDPGSGSFPDMRPFLDVDRDPSEPDLGPDTLAGATLEEGVDDCDRWLLTLTAPHCEGAYSLATDSQGNAVTIPCQVDKPTDDPQTWSEGSDLGAKVGIEVPAVAEAVQMPVALPATGGGPPVTP